MKQLLGSFLVLLLLVRCSDPNGEVSPSTPLVGSWKSADDEVIIAFDQDHHYQVQFGPTASFTCRYQLDTEEHQLLIYDSPVMLECRYQFVNEDELILTRVNSSSLANNEAAVGVYHRLP